MRSKTSSNRHRNAIELLIVVLLLGFSVLVLWWRIEALYDLVRTVVTAILIYYLGHHVLSAGSGHNSRQGEDRRANPDPKARSERGPREGVRT